MFVIFYFLILFRNSYQIQPILVKLLDESSRGAIDDFKVDSVRLLPSYFIENEDIPTGLTHKNTTSIICLNGINFTRSGEHNKFLSFEIEDYEHTYRLTKKIDRCDNSTCITAPKSTEANCPMEDLYESIKLIEVNDNFLLFSRGCYYRQFDPIKFEGGIIYQKENHQLSKEDYNLMLKYFGIQKMFKLIGLNASLSACSDECNQLFDDLTHFCKYLALYDNTMDTFIFIGVASTIYVLYTVVSVIYYNS